MVRPHPQERERAPGSDGRTLPSALEALSNAAAEVSLYDDPHRAPSPGGEGWVRADISTMMAGIRGIGFINQSYQAARPEIAA